VTISDRNVHFGRQPALPTGIALARAYPVQKNIKLARDVIYTIIDTNILFLKQ
jgi:hypothetical protein